MPTLIDGYNLLFATGHLTTRSGKHALEGARRALLLLLRSGHGPDAGDVTVVFDAQGAPPGVTPEQRFDGVSFRFATKQTADDLIEDIIRADPSPRILTVVSDDHRIQQAARRRGCRVLGCLDYCEQTLHSARPSPPAAAPEAPVKPDRSSPEETRQWLDAFGDMDDDPHFPDGY